MSRNLKWIFVLLISVLWTANSFAQLPRGCRRGGTIYTNPPGLLAGWSGGISETCAPGASRTTSYARYSNDVSGSPSCTIQLLGLGGTGTLVEYRLLNCPIDGWITFLLIPAAFVGILMIKRSQTV